MSRLTDAMGLRHAGAYRINISALKQYQRCPYRWWAMYVMNRVPLITPAALDGGKIYHRAFERYEDHGEGHPLSLREALAAECADFREKMKLEPEACQPTLEKAVVTFEDVIEAMDLHEDRFEVSKVLEVEQAHEWYDDVTGIMWIGRPDKLAVTAGRLWHWQRRGLASNKNLRTYVRLQNRSYHEHLYAEMAVARYPKYRGKYGGTIFDLLSKKKFRTYVGTKREQTKTAEEMFYQQPMSIDLNSHLHYDVMGTMRDWGQQMVSALRAWDHDGTIPPPNDEQNGGFSGSSEDPYFKVLMGEATLDDPTIFKAREDQYADRAEEA